MDCGAGGGRYPPIMSLPHSVLGRLAGILDGAAVHNWRTLIEHLPEYTQTDARQFATEEQQGRSPSMAILADLDSRGWSVVDLVQLAHSAQLGIIVDTIKEHCKERGWSLPFPPPSTLHSARMCHHRPSSPPHPTPPTTPTALREALSRYSSASTPEDGLVQLAAVHVPYATLHNATGGFSSVSYAQGGHKLGEGGSGEVFHCRISLVGGQGEQEIAVKVFLRAKDEKTDTSHSQDQKQFMAEIQALSMLSHAHLVPVLGFSCDGPQQCLLYPYLQRGSLDQHISLADTLTVPRRLKVACQVSSALEYLHTGCEHVFIHRDVKSANILVREDWSAALGDYGILRAQPLSGTVVTTTVAGTSVYMAPEYSKGGAVSEKIDVYSFGVVLFELLLGVTAHGPVAHHQGNDDGTDIVTFVEEFEGKISSVLIGKWQDDVGQGVWSLAEQCIHHNRLKRPSSTNVHAELVTLTKKTLPNT